jgi:hypothetical protein
MYDFGAVEEAVEHQTPSQAVRAATSVMRLILSLQEVLTRSLLAREVPQALTPVREVRVVLGTGLAVLEAQAVVRVAVVVEVPPCLTHLLLPVVAVVPEQRILVRVNLLSEQTAVQVAVSQVFRVPAAAVQQELTERTVVQAVQALPVVLAQQPSLLLVEMETLTTVPVLVVQPVLLVLVQQVLLQTAVQAPAVRLEVWHREATVAMVRLVRAEVEVRVHLQQPLFRREVRAAYQAEVEVLHTTVRVVAQTEVLVAQVW